jgi:hypothetical protein
LFQEALTCNAYGAITCKPNHYIDTSTGFKKCLSCPDRQYADTNFVCQNCTDEHAISCPADVPEICDQGYEVVKGFNGMMCGGDFIIPTEIHYNKVEQKIEIRFLEEMKELAKREGFDQISPILKVEMFNEEQNHLDIGTEIKLKSLEYEAGNLRLVLALKYDAEFDFYRVKVTPLDIEVFKSKSDKFWMESLQTPYEISWAIPRWPDPNNFDGASILASLQVLSFLSLIVTYPTLLLLIKIMQLLDYLVLVNINLPQNVQYLIVMFRDGI